jgi:hypothetical protein
LGWIGTADEALSVWAEVGPRASMRATGTGSKGGRDDSANGNRSTGNDGVGFPIFDGLNANVFLLNHASHNGDSGFNLAS